MAKENEPELRDMVEALKTLVMFLLKRMRDVTASVESLRVLLEQRGVFSHEQYETALDAALKEWARALGVAVAEATATSNDAELHRLLERLKLPPQ